MRIRPESPGDFDSVRHLNELAFGRTAEARLVERLRADADAYVSLVADDDGRVVGHVLLSPVRLHARDRQVLGMGLGPMAVLPDRQRRGVGSALVAAAIEACRDQGVPFLVVLGHPEYYPRFGFVPASMKGVRCEYDVPDEVFMVLELTSRGLGGGGLVKYHRAFTEVEGEAGA